MRVQRDESRAARRLTEGDRTDDGFSCERRVEGSWTKSQAELGWYILLSEDGNSNAESQDVALRY